MLIRTAEIDIGGKLEADVTIIGAGAAGITLANALERQRRNVVLLESGFETSDPIAQSLYAGRISGWATEPLDISRLRMFGGSTNHWAGWCRPLERIDFETYDGWPFEFEALEPHYQDAAEICELGPVIFDNIAAWRNLPGGERVDPLALDPKRSTTTIFQLSPPTNFADIHGPHLLASPLTKVLLGATALELIPAEDNLPELARKRIAGVRVSDFEGRQFDVHSPLIVCAQGGIECARFLLLSKAVYPTGAGNEHDLVGRYFMDHPWMGRAAYLQFSEPNPPLDIYFDQLPLGNAEIFAAIAPTESWRRREGLGGYRLVLRPTRQPTAGMDSLRAIGDSLSDGRIVDDVWQHLGAILGDLDVIADAAWKTLFNTKSGPLSHPPSDDVPVIGAYADLNIEQAPNRDSRVSLGDELDKFGQPRTVLDWQLSETDSRTAAAALLNLGLEAGRLGLGRMRLIEGSDALPEAWPVRMTGSRHHMGTARMSANARTGVTDSWGRVHSTENVFVAGSALFPTSGYANPTLTIVALALRQAAYLNRQLGR